MTDELKPVRCGCGGKAKAMSNDSHLDGCIFHFVKCAECGIDTPFYDTEAEAITAWNKAMGAKDINVLTKERTAKVIEHDASITDDRGYKYLRSEYLCENCKKKVIGGDEYCSHCGCRLEWK